MRRLFCYTLFMLVANHAFGQCIETEYTFKSGSGANYDEYLYSNTQNRELRNEGKQGKAYVCGNGCNVGILIRLQNAAVGAGQTNSDAVYECKQGSNGSRQNYQWIVHNIEQSCTGNAQRVSNVLKAGDLRKVEDKYCLKIVNVGTTINEAETNGWDAVSTIAKESGKNFRHWTTKQVDGTVQIIGTLSDNTVRIYEISADATLRVLDGTGKLLLSGYKATLESGEKVFEIAGDTLVQSLKITTDGVVKIIDSGNKIIQTLSDNTTKSYIATLELFETTIKEIGQTFRAVSGDVKDITVTAIEGSVEISGIVIDGFTQTVKYGVDGTVNIVDSFGRTTVGVTKVISDGIVGMYDSTGKTLVASLKILTDGTIQVLNTTGDVIKSLSKDTLESYKVTLQFFGKFVDSFTEVTKAAIQNGAELAEITIKEIGQTVRAVSGDVKDITVTAVEGSVEIVTTWTNNNTERFKILVNGGLEFNGQLVDLAKHSITKMTDGTIQVAATLTDGAVRTFEIATNGTVKLVQTGADVIKKLSGDSLVAFQSFLGSINTTIETAGGVINTAIKEGADVTKTFIEESFAFGKHFVTETKNLFLEWGKDDEELEKLQSQIAKCTTQEEVAALIENALRTAELSDTQCTQVQRMINQYAVQVNQKFDVIEGKIGSLAFELAEHKILINKTADNVAKLGSQYVSLANQMRTKVNAKQVLKLIEENTQNFTEGQLEELNKILFEYTSKLSDGQRKEVQGMIAKYVDPKIAALQTGLNKTNEEVEKEKRQRAAADKLQSAMSILNSFSSGAKVSVWKNKDGKFNAVRLASDATAGVVLGTVGGLVTNKLLKKNQIKKGFEKISCSVNGQIVADYADEFTVGVQQ